VSDRIARTANGHWAILLWAPYGIGQATIFSSCGFFLLLYRQHSAQRKAQLFNLLRGRYCTDGVKFGEEDGTKGPLLNAIFHLHRCNDIGIGPPKLKFFLLKFDQNVEYKRPAGAYPLRDFHKICRVRTPFQDALAVKISLNLLKGYGVMGVLS